MIQNIRLAFNELIDENDWMDEKAKKVAKEKVRIPNICVYVCVCVCERERELERERERGRERETERDGYTHTHTETKETFLKT